MGVASNGHCHADAAAAALYACGTAFPVANAGVASDGSAYSVVIECASTTGATLNLQRYRNGGSPSNQSVAFAGPTCDELQWLTYTPFSLSATDGALLATAVAGVWLAAWGWRAVIRTLAAGDSPD